MNTSYDKEEDKYEGINLDYKPSTTYPPNLGPTNYSDDETETIEKLLEDYYKCNIDHNHPNFHMIWK